MYLCQQHKRINQKQKKQHYVPQFYLNAWRIPNTNQINVYDIKTNKNRVNNVEDVASENHFYDMDFSEILNTLEIYPSNVDPGEIKNIENQQHIEKFLSSEIENKFAPLLTNIINKVDKMNKWEHDNCFFISDDDKTYLSFLFAIQKIRVKSVRNFMLENSDCLNQIFIDMKIPESNRKKFLVSKKEAKNTHCGMMLDIKLLLDLAYCFQQLTWTLGINKTNQHFYTSDNPIGQRAHIHDAFKSMSGLASKGIEVFFLISPNLILIICDGSYHTHMQQLERRMLEISNIEQIDYYNSLCAKNCHRTIFATDNNFSLIHKMIKTHPDIFNHPKVEVHYGGKKYTSNPQN